MGDLKDEDYEYIFEPGEIVSSHVVCQGPPACMLKDEEAIQAQIDGCIWCQRYMRDALGRETIIGPGSDE